MYTALYRKWRPLTFDDVVSQPHITTTLSRQIAEHKTAHAYLFTGSRGTGKTTCARIFAKAINCLNPAEGKPCLECEICKAADSGTLSDIIEIDAASNTGVDDIRELRDSTIYTPELCKYKVYIIDEVHMLSNQAFNALLKIMEEPPEHVKFILATTEVHKVPATIISRCQRFDFRRIRPEDIMARLMYIAGEEGFVLDEDAASLIARIADGAMRDALSLLDQCVAYSSHIDLSVVSDAAGIAGRDYLFDILEAVVDNDISKAISKTDELYSKSKDMTRLCDELLFQMRNLMLIKTVPDKTDLLACLESEVQRLKAIADKMSLDDILSRLDILQECSEAMQKCVSKRTEFEMTLVKLCTPRASAPVKASVSGDVSALVERINQLEREVARLKKYGVAVSSHKEDKPKREEMQETNTPLAKAEEAPMADNERKVCTQWEAIIERLTEVNPGCAGALRGSKAYTQGNYLLILVKNKFFLGLFKKPENAASLKEVAKEITGVSYSIRAKCDESLDETPARDPIAELIEKAKNADIPVDIN
ncbi:MAG: DNA polymerase III subunit gamma/tau [Oscillospiraceae bacterium]|nr:DNA polymerase III subunit gamma/tau [Oscillospiraceae bacterium]